MSWLGCERVELDVCESTNDEAARLARAGAVHGTIVIADAQTAGRGRGGHQWHSPPGLNLYLSCILRPAIAPAECPPLTLAAGLGVADAVSGYSVDCRLKWPNDVYVAGRKLAGILTEMSTQSGVIDHVVIGIGVNLNQAEFPEPLAATATSLRIATGAAVDRARFIDELLGACERWFDRLIAGGIDAVREPWNQRALRARVRVTGGVHVIEGRIAGIDRTGALVVIRDDGQHHTVIAGDVMLLDAGK